TGATGALDAAQWAQEQPMRIGRGFDIHRMAPHGDPEVGGPVTIGGVVFAYFELGIVAHLDGDVIYESIVESIVGALALPDIEQLFLDTDPRWKGVASDVFMQEAFRQMDQRGYRVGNIDVTLIAEAPRMVIKDHPLLLQCPNNRVNVKAKKHSEVGAVNEKRVISCYCVTIIE
ncbi:2-C-methyl-D-erythritol 2,4-cyclodiphosphate synthase, partial [Pavlovales sp. CCMP2436]